MWHRVGRRGSAKMGREEIDKFNTISF